ncbi:MULTISPECIES: hypothetical protein [unclassified Corynebacterium]|uniref:hypothetical protein n=1 Tax=unclassified Corynebacterium TaxID=2624378 RepID=UPI0003B8D773|nr:MULTISPECIES: hypothetical protein [unclassified Corynebacterium]ERS51127.1 hypothetical protein HMPREF1281_01802 [Corynebacterium sp. KPL1855]ERS61648.1 hypothetical protein HMPREF1257_01887 [Corynebacterium sp. KPL1814]ERS79925.1 hypothetical protein HMPREF1285_01034 [Corynebacterium sp. KPL1859]
MSDDDTLRLKVDGNPCEIELKALEKSVAAISKLIRAVGGNDVQQRIKGLKTGSAVVDVITEPEYAKVLTEGLEALTQTGQRPEKFNRTALTAVRDLYGVTTERGVTGVYFGSLTAPINVNREVSRHATEALKDVLESLGSVKGTLYKFNGRNRLTAGIEQSRTGKSIRLELEKHQVKTVLEHMQQEVLVRGLITRDPVTNEVQTVKVKDVSEVGEKKIQRPAYEVRGILGTEWLEGLDPVDIVRLNRDA